MERFNLPSTLHEISFDKRKSLQKSEQVFLVEQPATISRESAEYTHASDGPNWRDEWKVVTRRPGKWHNLRPKKPDDHFDPEKSDRYTIAGFTWTATAVCLLAVSLLIPSLVSVSVPLAFFFACVSSGRFVRAGFYLR